MRLIQALKTYRQEVQGRFHMPGHKGKELTNTTNPYLSFDFDVTEVGGLDNLHQPAGVIQDLLEEISRLYEVKQSYISTNGSTTCLQSAILGLTKPGESLIMSRDCHKAVYNATLLGDLKPIYLPAAPNSDIGLTWRQDLEEYEKILSQSNAKVVVVTYPTYYGLCCDIQALVNMAHRHGKWIIVDEAHGSHLKFSDRLPLSAEEAGADVIVQSSHKTLPALTQTSLLHVNTHFEADNIGAFMNILLTTSPSYLMMASLENAINFMADEGVHRIHQNLEHLQILKKKYPFAGQIYKDKSFFQKNGVFDFDETKLLFRFKEIGLTGNAGMRKLRKECGIEMEMADLSYVNGFMTAADDPQDLEALFIGVDKLVKTEKIKIKATREMFPFKYYQPKMEMTIRQAFYRKKENMRLNQSSGRIAGDYIIPYPPGIPMVCPGEMVTQENIEAIQAYEEANIHVMGIQNNEIKVIIE